MARKLLGDLMLPSARNRTGIYFFHDLVSEPVVALEILAMEPTESRFKESFANQSVPVYRKGSVGVRFGKMMASC